MSWFFMPCVSMPLISAISSSVISRFAMTALPRAQTNLSAARDRAIRQAHHNKRTDDWLDWQGYEGPSAQDSLAADAAFFLLVSSSLNSSSCAIYFIAFGS